MNMLIPENAFKQKTEHKKFEFNIGLWNKKCFLSAIKKFLSYVHWDDFNQKIPQIFYLELTTYLCTYCIEIELRIDETMISMKPDLQVSLDVRFLCLESISKLLRTEVSYGLKTNRKPPSKTIMTRFKGLTKKVWI